METIKVRLDLNGKKKIRKIRIILPTEDFRDSITSAFPDLKDRRWHLEHSVDGGVDWIEDGDEWEVAATEASERDERLEVVVKVDEPEIEINEAVQSEESHTNTHEGPSSRSPPENSILQEESISSKNTTFKIEALQLKDLQSTPFLEQLVWVMMRQLRECSDVYIWAQFERDTRP
eukprot:389339_1